MSHKPERVDIGRIVLINPVRLGHVILHQQGVARRVRAMLPGNVERVHSLGLQQQQWRCRLAVQDRDAGGPPLARHDETGKLSVQAPCQPILQWTLDLRRQRQVGQLA